MNTSAGTPSDSDPREPIEELAEAFLEQLRRGESPTIEEYAEKRPDLADRIRDLFPALMVMEDLGSNDEESSRIISPIDRQGLERLGEYRILREIARGGMGIVYEAEQESLGRRVALKVLPFRSFSDAVHLERFRQEARAAARLHHTNIVPVFGVGEDRGVQYYAMQYIHGQSLMDVLSEVKRLRQRRASDREPPHSAGAASAAGVARRLLSGTYAGDVEASSVHPTRTTRDGDHVERRVDDGPDRLAGRAAPPVNEAEPTTNSNVPSNDSSALDEPQIPQIPQIPQLTYHRSVARIGLQVAEALAYAHGEGILHRDIKPSNLLLDTRGTVWITDFGLAKDDESGDLTASGAVVGTLRYIAPERFHGTGEESSDIYSLGVTLYELLTLRPAFTTSDRAQLIQDVTGREPPAPRKVDSSIPRDLETIVLKAIARVPRDRYASALDFADDLRRFLRYEPVTARRATVPERLWRWCQRNPEVAFMSAAVAALTVTLAVVAVFSAVKLHDQLMSSRLEEGRAWRRSGVLGQRTRSLKALREAATGSAILDVRNEIIGSVSLTDMEVVDQRRTPEGGVLYDEHLERRATLGPDDDLLIFEKNKSEKPIAVFPRPAHPLEARPVRFSSTSRYLVGRFANKRKAVTVLDVDQARILFDIPDVASGLPVAFRGDDEVVAAMETDASIVVRSLPGGDLLRRFPAAPIGRYLRFDPSGSRLAVCGRGFESHVVRIHDVETGELLGRLVHPATVYRLAWSPDGETLATPCHDFNVYLWDARTLRRKRILGGHTDEVTRVAFSHNGRLLASSGWDNRTRLWDAKSGYGLLETSGVYIAFSRDDQELGFEEGRHQIGTWRIVGGSEFRLLTVPAPWRRDKTPQTIVFSGDGRWMAAANGLHGVVVWSVQDPDRWIRLAAPGNTDGIRFHPDGSLLSSNSSVGVVRWPLREGEDRSWTFGPPEPMGIRGNRFSLDREGRLLAILDGQSIAVHDLEAAGEVARFQHAATTRAMLSPSGEWLAASPWGGVDVRIWEVRTGELLKVIETREAFARFSPDDRQLAVGFGDRFEVYETRSWRPLYSIPRHGSGNQAGKLAFSRDARLIAVNQSRSSVEIHSARTGEQLALLETPDPGDVKWIEFSPDGSFIAAAAPNRQVVRFWNLRAIRGHLAALKLDWKPSLPEPGETFVPPPPPGLLRVDYGKHASWDRDIRLPAASRNIRQVELFTRLIDTDPSSENYAKRAAAHEKMGALDSAAVDLTRAIEEAPGDPELLEQRARLRLRAGQIEPALEDLNQVVDARRASLEGDLSTERRAALVAALLGRGDARLTNGQSADAAGDYLAILDLDPTHVDAARRLSWLWALDPESTERPEEALAILERSIARDSRDFAGVRSLGAALYRKGQLREAETLLSRASRLGGRKPFPSVLLYLAMIYGRTGRTAEARAAHATAVEWMQQGRHQDTAIAVQLDRILKEVREVLGSE